MSFPDLETIWYEDDPDILRCFACKEALGSEVLVRTFRLCSGDDDSGASKIVAESLGGGLAIYDRHLQCLITDEVQYVAISHVWNLTISRTQAQGRHSPQDAEVRRLVLDLPMGIARSVAESMGRNIEIWHDHISVPQWSEALKTPILQVIHKIFGSAIMTIAHLDDVSPTMIEKFLAGSSMDERSEGMLSICNAKWFSRVWTAMEYVRSPNIRVMDSESRLHGEVSSFIFQDRLMPFWSELVKKTKDVHELESQLGIGNNVMPWNLGPLAECRDFHKRNFGLAFALLCRRSCHHRDDFLYALHGVVTGSSVSKLEGSWDERYIGIAKYCLERGDYTPLLVTPELTQGLDVRNMPANSVNEGFHDVYAYSLGITTSPPLYHSDFRWEDGNVMLKTQKVGVITRGVFHADIFLDYLAAACAEFTGPDVEAFLAAYGSRLFFETKENMLKSLSIGNRYQTLKDTLTLLSETKLKNGVGWPAETPYNIYDLHEAIGLSAKLPFRDQSRLKWLNLGGTVLHLNWRQYLVWVSCPTCEKQSIFRAGLYRELEEVHDATVHRIPGLGYSSSWKDGVCLVVKGDGQIIGRMIWATPNCECDDLGMVKLQLPYLLRLRAREDFLRRLGRL